MVLQQLAKGTTCLKLLLLHILPHPPTPSPPTLPPIQPTPPPPPLPAHRSKWEMSWWPPLP
jgi:hypothetical protein